MSTWFDLLLRSRVIDPPQTYTTHYVPVQPDKLVMIYRNENYEDNSYRHSAPTDTPSASEIENALTFTMSSSTTSCLGHTLYTYARYNYGSWMFTDNTYTDSNGNEVTECALAGSDSWSWRAENTIHSIYNAIGNDQDSCAFILDSTSSNSYYDGFIPQERIVIQTLGDETISIPLDIPTRTWSCKIYDGIDDSWISHNMWWYLYDVVYLKRLSISATSQLSGTWKECDRTTIDSSTYICYSHEYSVYYEEYEYTETTTYYLWEAKFSNGSYWCLGSMNDIGMYQFDYTTDGGTVNNTYVDNMGGTTASTIAGLGLNVTADWEGEIVV